MSIVEITKYVCEECESEFDEKPEVDVCHVCGSEYCPDCNYTSDCRECKKVTCHTCTDGYCVCDNCAEYEDDDEDEEDIDGETKS